MIFIRRVLFLIILFFVGMPMCVKAYLQSTRNFSIADGLLSNIVFDIFQDSRELVWFAADAVLFEFIGEEIKFRKELSRLQGERINSICEDEKGNLWFSAQIHGEDWMPHSSLADEWTNSPIELNYGENDLAFTFGMDFCQNISNVRFRYLLDGFDEKWSNWSSSSDAVFSHLPSGNYTLKVEGKHLNEGVIIPSSFDIIVKPSWWKMWWFIILLSLIFGGLVYVAMWGYAYFIRKREKERIKQSNRVIVLKMKSLQNQLDPHFIFNSLNSIQSYILEEKKESALEYLSDFSNVLRKKIENANKDFISLSDEIAYLQLYLKLEQMRFSNKFSYKITANTAINPFKSKLPPMLIQPFLENAIRYGFAALETKGNLDVNFEIEQDGYLRCIIKDNGVGRKKAKDLHEDSNIKVHHKTMIITQDRIKLLNKVLSNGRIYEYFIEDLTDEKGFPSGTKVVIGFPKQ
ncbi:hypothetical protein GNY23_08270 [Labilibaculum sp. 44]|uniref:Signal transduction histidine kinase internal region domain-containing protein n=1 Tax=Labilibaculum euxinus TaxID=2686357 RepID=A0A7M4D575_9BACT|nr:hypothetical protein [Labilibaculum euxinus]MVB07009.1 hypothetical protein [Labilibaculum euxinus]